MFRFHDREVKVFFRKRLNSENLRPGDSVRLPGLPSIVTVASYKYETGDRWKSSPIRVNFSGDLIMYLCVVCTVRFAYATFKNNFRPPAKQKISYPVLLKMFNIFCFDPVPD